MNELDSALRWLGVACELTLVVLLWRRGLWDRYRWFSTYLTFDSLQTLALMPFAWNDPRYCVGWGLSEILVLIAMGGSAIEAARQLWGQCPELRVYSRFVFALCLVLCFAIGAAAALVEVDGPISQGEFMSLILGALRSVSWMVVVFLLAQGLWFGIFDLPMRANVRWHRWMLIVYGGVVPGLGGFLVEQYARNGDTRSAAITNLAMMTVNIVCLSLWCVILNPRGELVTSATPMSWDEFCRIRTNTRRYVANELVSFATQNGSGLTGAWLTPTTGKQAYLNGERFQTSRKSVPV